MSSLTLAAQGVDQVAGTLTDAGHEIASLADVHRGEGQRALAAADIPYRTGRLADGASVVATDDGYSLTAAATYAGFVHARDPFFTRAINAREAALLDAVTDHVETALSHVRGA